MESFVKQEKDKIKNDQDGLSNFLFLCPHCSDTGKKVNNAIIKGAATISTNKRPMNTNETTKSKGDTGKKVYRSWMLSARMDRQIFLFPNICTTSAMF